MISKRQLSSILMMLACTMAVGCKKKLTAENVCEDGCSAMSDCDSGSQSDCREECEEDLKDADKECLKAFRDFADCADTEGCDNIEEECLGEAIGVLNDCEELFEGGFEDDDECCNASNSCGWDNDGFCDCDGVYSWDSVDCQ